MKTSRDRKTTTLTLSIAAMLLVSLVGLAGNVAPPPAEAMAVNAQERFPNLYAPPGGVLSAPETPTVYLTFDDGPSPNTQKILDVLAERDVKATFFVCAQYEDKEFSAETLRRIVEEGHTIGLHTDSHDYAIVYTTLDGYLEDLSKVNDWVVEATGVKPVIMRFPGGSKTSNCDPQLMRQIADEVTRRGYIFHDWTVVSGDDGSTALPASTIADNVLSNLTGRRVEVILFHDNPTPTTTPEAVEIILDALLAQGYAFDRLDSTVPPEQFINRAA